MSHFNAALLERAQELIALYPTRVRRSSRCALGQEQDGWLRPEAMSEIGELVGVTAAEVQGTATFL